MNPYKTEKAFVDDAVKAFLMGSESAFAQARDGGAGIDGISNETATDQARRIWSALQRARLFTVHPERWLDLYKRADRYTHDLAGIEWTPYSPETPPDQASADKLTALYMEDGPKWPFPDRLPFDSVFFSYGCKHVLPEMYAELRLTRAGLAKLGNPKCRLLGQLLAWEGDTPFAWTVMGFDMPTGAFAGWSATYRDGEWYQPATLDPWVLTMIVDQINQHKRIIQPYAPTFANRLDRKNLSKQAKQLLPLPAPFYMVGLKDELVTPPRRPLGGAPRAPREHSHRWDVRGHECVRIERGELPMCDKVRTQLRRRGYKIYEGMSVAGDDAMRLLKRGVRAPGPREWVAVLSYWRDAHIKGDPRLPYVPAARTGV